MINKSLILVFIISILSFFSCDSDTYKVPKSDRKSTNLKHGIFEIPAKDNISKQEIIRQDSIQIEKYTINYTATENNKTIVKELKRVDTFYVKWSNNFAYTLKMKNPKTELDKKLTMVQINKVTDSSYNYTATIGRSHFKQKGTINKIK